MDSMIYKVSRHKRKGLGYVPYKDDKPYFGVDNMVIKYTPLKSHFTYGHPHDIKYTSESYYAKSYDKTKFKQNFEKYNQKVPKKIWVPKDKIVYVADVFDNKVETPVMIPGIWMLSTHDGKKAYVLKSGT